MVTVLLPTCLSSISISPFDSSSSRMDLCFFMLRPQNDTSAVWFSSPYSTSFRMTSLTMYILSLYELAEPDNSWAAGNCSNIACGLTRLSQLLIKSFQSYLQPIGGNRLHTDMGPAPLPHVQPLRCPWSRALTVHTVGFDRFCWRVKYKDLF